MKEQLRILKKHILTGTSHMIPFIVAGGILFSLAVMLNPEGAATPETGWLAGLAQIGLGGLTLFIPVLGGYIAYSIADKPGLAPGMIGAYLAREMGAGFLGGMAAGLIAGVVVKELKRIKLPIALKTLGSIFIYPLVGTLVTGGIIVWGIGGPIAALMNGLTAWLSGLGDVGKVPLASILGAMTAFDMGGPINKVATLFAQTQVDTLPYLMGGVGVAICTPPIGMGIATLLAPKKYNVEEKEAGKAAILMGCVGITEGAIPFAANDPLRVIPSLIVGAVAGNIIPFLTGVLNHAPWGGIIVLPVVEGKIWYLISVLAGGFVTAVMVNLLKKDYVDVTVEKEDTVNLDEITFDEF
ncbi:PTS fructose transporter subunit EIIC [Lachnoclostridium pacaense]|uniref:PTS fructose transporter subunit EIIC n=1 Tax=Enterocloster hominis (ex Hitch et al. 2024) TaxID=1917870 RepID=UPI001D107123|nr:PTS fructose transporter subunit EIIC [Lachnoclostridium pacaense]MCC2878466.1 PTS fructose transporter subunit EIIC [Lachnoclostridium pacaense]